MSYRGKRALDLAIAVPVLLITLPIQAISGLAVAATLGSPVLFRQTRPGLNGEPFELIKFRTMRPVDSSSQSNDDASRLTRTGSFLRATSVDELPSLWNVIRGDLSLVGPRPLLMQYLELYTPDQARRMEVKPGLTGLAQVSGRNLQSWEDRFVCDVTYVDNVSLWLDLKIILRTIMMVIRREGVSAHDHATKEQFKGA